MPEWLLWFTRFENSKIVALLLFFITFCGILIYVFTGKQRSSRIESISWPTTPVAPSTATWNPDMTILAPPRGPRHRPGLRAG